MTDNTSHNLTVIESMSEELDATPPLSLKSNIRPLFIFQGKTTKVFQELHHSLGKKKVLDCFLLHADLSYKEQLNN